MSEIPPILHQILAGRYVLKREIGRGGAATVYLAHDVRHERLVAVKVLHPELSHALGAQRFMREIKLTASLQHPHILPIHDSGEADGQLFYVMPYVEGDSLRSRLGADNRLSVEAAVRIGREVAGALAYAHERGVVHRDIKPENILFSGGHAVLADFGIARAINRASEKITQQGTITGTPAYMSPEQARDRAFDGRSDVYSLSCVLYEAIAGVPPYVGDTPQQLLSQRVAKAPPLLREYRHDVPVPIETVIAKALSISPDDRYDDARAFSAALSAAIGNSGESLSVAGRRRPLTSSPLTWAAGVLLAITVGAAVTPGGRERIDLFTRRVDTAQYAVLPFQYVGTTAPAIDVEPAASGAYDAMRRWDGLALVDELSVSDAVRREGGAPLTLDAVVHAARSVRAGRAVWGRVRVAGDSLVVRAGVYDALTGESLREVTRTVRGGPGALRDLDYRSLTSDLLRGPRPSTLSPGADRGTTSYAAWQAFERGANALVHWDLESAKLGLTQSIAADPAYPQANLWLAQLRFLQDENAKEWATPLLAATRGHARLDAREQALTDALTHVASADFPAACRAYDALRRADSLDAMAWLGLALCQSRDRAVVHSRASRTGFAYRASYEGVWRAMSRALEIAPEAFVLLPYDMLRRHMPMEHNFLRWGRAGSEIYLSWPYLSADTVAYDPETSASFGVSVPPAGYDAALRLNRARVLGVLELLTRRMPESPDAFEALASLLEVRDEITGTPNGHYSALTALERARTLAVTPDQRIRLAVADLRLHLKLGDFARSAATADSLLRANPQPTPSQATWLVGVAEYVGRAGLAARLEHVHAAPEARSDILVPAADQAVTALLMRSALGICDDSTGILIRSVDRTLASYVGASDRAAVRVRLLERPLSLAAPCDGGRLALQLTGVEMDVYRAEQLIARGDRAGARRVLDSLDLHRSALQPGAVSLDHVVLEAWAREQSGDTRGAAARLDVALSALSTLSPQVVTEPGMAAAVGRAMAYRAELADRLGDRASAALWASRVQSIWATADPALAPTLARMRVLASKQAAR